MFAGIDGRLYCFSFIKDGKCSNEAQNKKCDFSHDSSAKNMFNHMKYLAVNDNSRMNHVFELIINKKSPFYSSWQTADFDLGFTVIQSNVNVSLFLSIDAYPTLMV